MREPILAEPVHGHLPARANLGVVLLVLVLVILALGAFPRWGHSRNWRDTPSGTLGVVLLGVLLFAALGQL